MLDLAEIDQLSEKLWLFSRNRFNLFGFYDRDFGENESEPLTDYIHRKLAESGIHKMPTQILLSCYPRVLGYVFNPLSLYYCLDNNGHCFAVVHEVHNTFGERHAYVLAVARESDSQVEPVRSAMLSPPLSVPKPAGSRSGNGIPAAWIHQSADKELFVSPFAHMGMRYQFRLCLPEEKQVVVIRAADEHGLLITASYTARRRNLQSAELVRLFFRIPLMTVKVVAGIHWEALRLWIKGVPLFKHQPKRSN